MPMARRVKRARGEAFTDFSVPTDGVVVVTNASYGEEKDTHTHVVNVADGEPVVVAADAEPDARAVATDGGRVLEPETGGSGGETAHAPECENPECEGIDADGRPLLSFPCWNEWAGR